MPKTKENIDFETECINAFIKKMNEKAIDLGLKNTAFKNPVGNIIKGERNLSTSDDLTKIIINASSYPEIYRIWGKKNKTINIYGRNPRKLNIKSTIQNEEFEKEYYILGGKTGTWQSPPPVINLSILTTIEDNIIAATIGMAKDENSIWASMKELLDICKNTIQGKEASKEVVNAECASACIIPNTLSAFAKYPFKFLFSQNGSKIIMPSSITKVMTAIVALDYIADLHKEIKIIPYDADINSENLFGPDDVITLEDAFHTVLLSSSNQVAKALARYTGEIILRKHRNYS